MSYKPIDDLAKLLESYQDIEAENVLLQNKLLEEGFIISTKIFTKSPSLRSLIVSKGIRDNFISYIRSYDGRYRNYSDDAKSKLLLFYDDLWDIEVLNTEFNIPIFSIDGHQFIHVMKQGVNGILPKIIKNHFKVKANDEKFKDKIFQLKIKINTQHPNYNKTLRFKMVEELTKSFKTPEEELQSILNPGLLFRTFNLNKASSDDKELFNERLKLWNRKVSSKDFKETELNKLIQNLPINTFGLVDMITLRNVSKSFHTKVSNEVLLTGQLAHTHFSDVNKRKFNQQLKLALN